MPMLCRITKTFRQCNHPYSSSIHVFLLYWIKKCWHFLLSILIYFANILQNHSLKTLYFKINQICHEQLNVIPHQRPILEEDFVWFFFLAICYGWNIGIWQMVFRLVSNWMPFISILDSGHTPWVGRNIFVMYWCEMLL